MENASQIDVLCVCIYSIIFHILCLIIDKLLKQHQHQHELPIVIVAVVVFQVDLLCVWEGMHNSLPDLFYRDFQK